jgi:hypothetical protein
VICVDTKIIIIREADDDRFKKDKLSQDVIFFVLLGRLVDDICFSNDSYFVRLVCVIVIINFFNSFCRKIGEAF